MADGPAIVWFRDDLRVSDNPALDAGARSGRPILCVYVHDEDSPGLRPLGGAARWWLHGSLASLDEELRRRGASLTILRGPARQILDRLATAVSPAAVTWSRRYGPAETAVDSDIKAMLGERGIGRQSFNGALLYEPWEIATNAGAPMRVFTPFWKSARAKREPAAPIPAPKKLKGASWRPALDLPVATLDELGLEPKKPDWAKGFSSVWTRGEPAAQERLADFLDEALAGYAEARDRPDRPGTSRLSPYLRFGNISPRQIWAAATQYALAHDSPGLRNDLQKLQSELGWREFSYHLLFHHSDLAATNLQARFDAFPWVKNDAHGDAWRRGLTGYPLVDAGMRELWRTGWMHNRARMVVGSFLVKHLQIDWREGERWFWDTLVDADPANNAASWQWIAGTGADAAPYFRIMNPTLQGEKFDPRGAYVRTWIPELAGLPDDIIHQPWKADRAALSAAGVEIGKTYPHPIVDHRAARDRALAAFASLKSP